MFNGANNSVVLLIVAGAMGAAAFLTIRLMRGQGRAGRKSMDREVKLEGGERAGWTPSEDLPPDMVKLRAWMRRLAEPTFLFAPSKEVGFSKIGGLPALPTGVEAPTGAKGPLPLLCQFDFAELPKSRSKAKSKVVEWLPTEGRLYAFLEQHSTTKVETVRLIYSRDQPAPDAAQEGFSAFGERAVAFRRFKSAPSYEWLGDEADKFDYGDCDGIELREEAAGIVTPSYGGVRHRVGGFPDNIYPGSMAETCELSLRGLPTVYDDKPGWEKAITPEVLKAAKDWRLLLQFDSDRASGMSWGDGGMLYVLIRRSDAAKLDFSRTVTLFECH